MGIVMSKRRLPPDEHTIYYLASLSKSFTAALIGIVGEQAKIAWNMPIKRHLTQRISWDEMIREKANIVD